MKIKTLLMAIVGLFAIVPIALVDLDESKQKPLTQEKMVPQPFSFFSFQQDVDVLDESLRETIDQRFSLSHSLEQIQQIETALEGFLQLAETHPPVPRQASTIETDETERSPSREAQILGVQNWVDAVEGTLRKQNLEIKQLELELAQKQFEAGEINEAELEKKRLIYQQAYSEFLNFWNDL